MLMPYLIESKYLILRRADGQQITYLIDQDFPLIEFKQPHLEQYRFVSTFHYTIHYFKHMPLKL